MASERLFIASAEETIEVTELMASGYIADHELAIDALRGWCNAKELITEPPERKDFYDTHHWYNRANGRGKLGRQHRERYTDTLRRDIHESVEQHFGWLSQPIMQELVA